MPIDISRVKALCFDVDGTLSDTDDQFVQRLAHWFAPIRFVFPHRDPRPFARRIVMATETPGNFFFGLPDRLGIDGILASLGDLIYRRGLGNSDHPFLLVPGANQALQKLRPHYPLSIVSARGQRSTQAFLHQYQLLDYFLVVATAHTCEHTKPYPDPILWTAERMRVAPENCLMIGDTTVDIRAGKSAGAQTIGVLSGFGERAELVRAGADLILPDVNHLPALLLDPIKSSP